MGEAGFKVKGRFSLGGGGCAAEFFIFAFAAFEFLGGGSELGVEGFEMGFAFEEGALVVA